MGDAGVPAAFESHLNLAEQAHQIIDATFEEAAALQRQTVMKEEYTAKLDQTPQAILGAVIRHERERVVGDAELDDSCQVRVASVNGIEFLLRDTDRVRATTERGIALEALGQTLGRDALCEPTNEMRLWEVPFEHHLGRPFAQQLVLDAAGECRIVAAANELSLRLRDELGCELKELLGILRARIAQRVHAEEVRSIVLVQQVDARPIGDPGVNGQRSAGLGILGVFVEQAALRDAFGVALE